MSQTRIDWADTVWNPVTGCTHESRGCDNCYALRMAKRLRGRAGYPAVDPFAITYHYGRLGEPLTWRKPRRVFVCSMGDLFHPHVAHAIQRKIWTVMGKAPQHRFMILTKRPGRMRAILDGWEGYTPLPNVWLGVSAEDQAALDERARDLVKAPAAVVFLSLEPLLGPVNLRGLLPCIDWVIAGGETGPGARPMHPQWALDIRDQCEAAQVPFWFKQWGEWEPGCARANRKKPARAVFQTGESYPATIEWNADRCVCHVMGGHADRMRVQNMTPDGRWKDGGPVLMTRAGKAAAGRSLQGVTHQQEPELCTHA